MTSFGATTPITSRSLNTAFLQLESLISSPNANSLSGTTLAANVVNSSLTSVGTLVSGSIPATLLTGTVASARLSGSYTGITGLGTLTSLTVDGVNSPAITIGDWSGSSSNSAIESNSGHLILGFGTGGAVYLRTNNVSPVYIGANGTNTLTVGNAVVTVAGSMNATTFSGSGASLTSLPAGQLTGNVSSSRLSGDYSGITGLGTLTTLTIGGAGANRVITINAPTGYYAIQYFQIGGVYKWHYEVNPAGDRWSLVQTGVAERIGVTSTGATFSGTVTSNGALNAYSISGNSNVAGTGNASYHPSGVYSTGTNWLYGTILTNGNPIGSLGQYCGAVYSNNWFRSSGTTGWYSEAYAAGIYSKATQEVWTYNASRFIASNNSGGANYASQQLEVRSNDLFSGGSVAGISFHVYGANAPVLRYWTGTGAGLDVGNEGGTGYWYMGANNFVTRSSMRWKTDIRRRPQEQIVEVGLRLLEGETAIWDSKDIEPIFDEENECYIQPCAEQRELVKDDWIQRRHFNKRGYIVEELEKVFPEAVHYESDGKPSGVDYGVITTELVDILKLVVLQNSDQQRRIEFLEQRLQQLETV